MKKISIAILSFTLFSTLTVIGCGVSSNNEATTKREVIDVEKEKDTTSKKEHNGVNIQVGSKDGVNVNLGDNNKTLDVQVGSKEDGVSVKMGEGGLKVNVGDKDSGVSINLGSLFK